MRKIIYILVLVSTFIFTSCEMVEEITINEDGSGKLSYNYNMSKLLEIMPEGSAQNGKAIDSTFVFRELLENPKYKDSLKNMTDDERKMLASLKDMSMHINMNPEEKKMIMGFGWDFKDINEIPNIFEKMQQAQKIKETNKNGNPMEESPLFKGMSGENQDISYSFNGSKFSRITTLKKELSEDELKSIDEMLNQDEKVKDMFGEMKYTIKLNFTKPIKSINNEHPIYSNNKKSVKIEFNMADFLKSPKKLNLEVQLVD